LIDRVDDVFCARQKVAFGVDIINPFTFLLLVYDEHSLKLEADRNQLDITVRELEGRTGNTALRFDPALRSNDYHEQIGDLHKNRSFLQFFEHAAQFHISLGNFFCQQYKVVADAHQKLGGATIHGSEHGLESSKSFGVGSEPFRDTLAADGSVT
jgi:hypothetical protein